MLCSRLPTTAAVMKITSLRKDLTYLFPMLVSHLAEYSKKPKVRP